MTGAPKPSHEVRNLIAGAHGAAMRAGEIGTEHLLVGLAMSGGTGRAAQVLTAAQLAGPVVMELLRQRRRPEAWQSDDGAGDNGDHPPPGEHDWFQTIRKPMSFTSAARAALHRAAALAQEQGLAEVDQDHVLRGLLTRGDNRAVELVRGCGVEPASLLEQLRGTAPVAEAEDPVAPELRPTRDVLLGKASYRSGRFSGRVANTMLRFWPVVEVPTAWVQLEAPEQARRLGGPEVGTEHLVLGILAVTETLRSYPHLRPDDASYRYLAGEVLAEAGVTYHGAREVVRDHPDRLGRDAQRWSSFRHPARYKRSFTGTGELLLALLTQDDSRAANLLRQLGVAPAGVREQLRARLAGR